jgi:hypothetical protein
MEVIDKAASSSLFSKKRDENSSNKIPRAISFHLNAIENFMQWCIFCRELHNHVYKAHPESTSRERVKTHSRAIIKGENRINNSESFYRPFAFIFRQKDVETQ